MPDLSDNSKHRPWWTQLNGYHWFVMIVASLAWFFDCLDQRLFSLARNPALKSLMPEGTPPGDIQAMGKEVTALFLVGWGIGGMIFGALGDRYGRSKMLTATVLLYSIFTGLSFFSVAYWDFAIYRFLTGVGVGGVFGLAVALIAETVPDRARAGALGTLQVLSTIGNISAAFIKMGIDSLEAGGTITPGNGWRWLFLVGALPAFLVFFIRGYLKEPEPWLKMKREGRLPTGGIFAPYAALLSDKRWRHNLIVGAIIASTGVVGLWAIGEYAVDLQRIVFRKHFEALGTPAGEIDKLMNAAVSKAYLLSMVGAALGMSLFTWICGKMGRRPAFVIGFSSAAVITALVYWKMNSPMDAYWMTPLMSGAQLGILAGFAIYLPELFPSRLRSTGTSFCYNLGRFAAAGGSFFSAALAQSAYGNFGSPMMERYSAMTMCAIYIVGIVAVIWAPETKDKPLPED
ncbi:MFS transporter [Luteolibacter sp. GHJ8]|uniref:MFS transporter n=1 Tax=Luteolibacter rhizosphaerae TaxID=2989719 RepID=A0ABT3G9B9_9BACT|nr:MFS transporter [Luteolibacter rhizosphaerae]MCW1916452.1 MFS transporter [Luteolibacter rhizosphaerae]